MTLEELAKKAIEESNGKMFYGVGNSSRGKSALPLFIAYLQTIDPSYNMEFEWQQPKNNKIFDQLTADALKPTGTYAMTLIQDGNQIESKMVQTGVLDTFIPKDWAEANGTTAEEYKGFLALQTLNKVFMYNNTGSKTYDNCWDFVAEGEHGLYMDIDSEIVGKNFLYMLTEDTYAGWLKEAYNALPAEEQAYFQPTVKAMESEAADLGLGPDGAYALAWIKLWVESAVRQRVLSKGSAQVLAVDQPFAGRTHLAGVAVHQQSALPIPKHIRHAADSGRHNGQSRSHGLDDGHGHSLILRR